MKKCTVGGQAVLEGVMMKAPDAMAIAVRCEDGTIDVKRKALNPASNRHPILKLPIIRGIISFGEAMVQGIRSLMDSVEIYGDQDSDDFKPSKFETFIAKKLGKNVDDVIIFFAILLAMVFSVGLFILLPALIASLFRRWIENHIVVNILEGLVRIMIFLAYIIAVSQIKDIKRVFEYHGAEHKTIHCYEHEEDLTVENARKYTTLHPRCGTAFLLIVMVISIMVFSFLRWENILIRVITRLLLLPVIAGLSYEVTRLAGRSDSAIVRAIIYPGLLLQKLTTREPDDDQLEVAIRAFNAAMGIYEEEETDGEAKLNGPDTQGSTALAGQGS